MLTWIFAIYTSVWQCITSAPCNSSYLFHIMPLQQGHFMLQCHHTIMGYAWVLIATKEQWGEATGNATRFRRTVYPKKYAHGFVVLCFVVVMQSFIINSHEVFIHIHQGCFAGTGAIVRLPQCQWSKPDGYGKISQYIDSLTYICVTRGRWVKRQIIYVLFQQVPTRPSSNLVYILYCVLYLRHNNQQPAIISIA